MQDLNLSMKLRKSAAKPLLFAIARMGNVCQNKFAIALLLKAKQTHIGSLVLLKSNNKRLGVYNGGKYISHGKCSIALTVYYKWQVGKN